VGLTEGRSLCCQEREKALRKKEEGNRRVYLFLELVRGGSVSFCWGGKKNRGGTRAVRSTYNRVLTEWLSREKKGKRNTPFPGKKKWGSACPS